MVNTQVLVWLGSVMVALLAAAVLGVVVWGVCWLVAWAWNWRRFRSGVGDDYTDDDGGNTELRLAPERTWEQMTSHQLPALSRAEYQDWQRREDARRKQARRVEMTHRAHYAAMRMDYPSGLLERVRELAP